MTESQHDALFYLLCLVALACFVGPLVALAAQ